MSLSGKVAIVTGAARGLGRAIALTLAREGASLVVNDLNLEGARKTACEVRALAREALAIKADVSKREEVHSMIAETLSHFGKVDILVNNAGIVGIGPRLEDLTEEEWNRTIDVDLKGVFLCSQAVIEPMKKQRYGKIINIASLAATTGGKYAPPDYPAAKAGVLGLTKAFAKHLARYNINVNAVSPGTLMTDMMKGFPKETIDELLKAEPLGRFGTPEEIAEIVAFLASDKANWITGANLAVDGMEQHTVMGP